MKKRFLIAILLLPLFSALGYGQSTLYFPKLFSLQELTVAGFAVVNPGPTSASVVFTLTSEAGVAIHSAQPRTIAAGGQLSIVGIELFPGAVGGGWVRANSTTTGLQGFWLIYDGLLKSIDGADAATAAADLVIPLVAGRTEINVVNPNSALVSVTLRLYNADGQETGSVTQGIVANGVLQNLAADLFGSAESTARYVRVTSASLPILATAVISGYLVPRDTAVVNGVDRSSTLTEANFPHVINGVLTGANYTTIIGVTNLTSSAQTVTITFTPASGSAVAPFTQSLPANGSLRLTAQDLFNLGTAFREGWVKVRGSAGITAFAAYGDTLGGAFAVVPAGTAKTNLLFAHIADGPSGLPANWETGLAFLNAGNSAASIDLFAMTPGGLLIGSQTGITLGPGQKISKQLHGWISQVQGVNGGFIFARSNVPLYAIEVFYTADVTILSNVSALPVVQGITYTPPTTPSGGTGGSGGLTGNNGPASPCINPSVFNSVRNIHLEYNVTGAFTGTSVSDTISSPNVQFQGNNTTEFSSTSTTSYAGQPVTSSAKSYSSIDGLDLITYGTTGEITTPVAGSFTSVFSPPYRDRRYSLAAGATTTQTYSVASTTNFPGLGSFSTTSSATETVRYLGRDNVSVLAGTFDTCKFEVTDGANAVSIQWIAAGNAAGVMIKSSGGSGSNSFVLEFKTGTINGSGIQP